MRTIFSLLFLGLLGITSAVQAVDPAASSAVTDKNFAVKAAQDGLAEVEMGKLAQERASSASVKQFAEQLVAAHSSSNEQLKKIASSQGIKLPKTLSKEDQKLKDELAKLSGAEFDQRFMETQIEDHQKAIELFQQQASQGRSAELKNYAKKTLPHLESHLQSAQKLATSIGSTSSR